MRLAITSEPDGTFMFFGHGEKVAKWMCGDKEDDLRFYGTQTVYKVLRAA